MKVEIQRCEENKSNITRKILESLPEWFGDVDAREDYIEASNQLDCIKAMIGDEDVGFLALKMHHNINAEVYCMGVLPKYHRCGVGQMLIRKSEDIALEKSAKLLTVKTLSSTSQDPHYKKTRAFYAGVGFAPFEDLPTLWGVKNPCLIMIKQLEEGA